MGRFGQHAHDFLADDVEDLGGKDAGSFGEDAAPPSERTAVAHPATSFDRAVTPLMSKFVVLCIIHGDKSANTREIHFEVEERNFNALPQFRNSRARHHSRSPALTSAWESRFWVGSVAATIRWHVFGGTSSASPLTCGFVIPLTSLIWDRVRAIDK